MILDVDGLSSIDNIKNIESLIFPKTELPLSQEGLTLAFSKVENINKAEKTCSSGQGQVIESPQKKIKISDSQE
jgi:hypothetical protein